MRTEQILAEQRVVADTDRRHRLANKGQMPPGLTPEQQIQWRSWGWFDQRQRAKPTKYNFQQIRPQGRAASPVAFDTGKSTTMRFENV
jgi:hypothetical protein